MIIKHFPLHSHRFAKKAALAALAAEKQGKYLVFARNLFQNYRNLNPTNIKSYAQHFGLNMDQFVKDLNNPHSKTIITQDLAMGRQANVRGVPTIFIGGKRVKRRNLPGLIQAVKKELKK